MWTEMTVDLQLPGTKSFSCSGVVVACTGNRHTGFNVSLVASREANWSPELGRYATL